MVKSRKIRTLQYKDTDLYYQSKLEFIFLESCELKGILNKVKNGLAFKYVFDNINRLYVSDFYIPEHNLIIEIKSYNNHGLNKTLENKNHAKWEKVLESGFNFKVLVDKQNVLNFFNTYLW